MGAEKMRHCPVCGDEIGISSYQDPDDTCGERECEREMRNARDEERERRHEELDRELGYF